LNKHIVAQEFTLTKAVILSRHSLNTSQGLLGNLEINIDSFRGSEIVSNKTNGKIPIPISKHYGADQLITHDHDFNLSFNAENLPFIFDVEVFGYFPSTGKTSLENLDEGNIQRIPATTDGYFATTAGEGYPISIDLYLDYQTNHTFF